MHIQDASRVIQQMAKWLGNRRLLPSAPNLRARGRDEQGVTGLAAHTIVMQGPTGMTHTIHHYMAEYVDRRRWAASSKTLGWRRTPSFRWAKISLHQIVEPGGQLMLYGRGQLMLYASRHSLTKMAKLSRTSGKFGRNTETHRQGLRYAAPIQ